MATKEGQGIRGIVPAPPGQAYLMPDGSVRTDRFAKDVPGAIPISAEEGAQTEAPLTSEMLNEAMDLPPNYSDIPDEIPMGTPFKGYYDALRFIDQFAGTRNQRGDAGTRALSRGLDTERDYYRSLDMALPSEILNREGSPYKGMSISEAIRKRREEGVPDANKPLTSKALQKALDENKEEAIARATTVPEGDEITRARASMEPELDSDDLQKALKKNEEEAIAARTAGPSKPSGLNSEVGKKAVTTLNTALSQEGNEDVKADIGQKYIDEFMARMPEYEGKTGFEKGMDLMKFGMAIAAGDSPNAIANISKGFLAMGDTFTKDAKERRQYKRELGLAAAKYGLERINKDRDLDEADKRQISFFVDKNGKSVALTRAQILEDPSIVGKYTSEEVYKSNNAKLSASSKTQEAYLKELVKKGVLSQDQVTSFQDKYGKAAQDIISANTGIGYFQDAMDMLAAAKANPNEADKITGIAGAKDALVQKVANLAGIKRGQKYTAEQFTTKLRLGFQKLIPLTLADAQSANSISNRDVEILAKALLGANILDGDGVFNYAAINEDVLYSKLQESLNIFHNARQSAYSKIKQYEGDLGRTKVPDFEAEGGAVSALTIIEDIKKANPKLRGQLKDLEDRLKEFEIQNIDLSEEDQKSIIDFDDMYESVRDDETGEFITFKRRLVS